MKNWVSHILTVQKLDARLHALEIKYRTIPSEKARIDAEIEEASGNVKNAADKIKSLESGIRKAQGENAALAEKMRKTQTQSTMVKKNTEYQAMMSDIEKTKAKISELETSEISLYEELDTAKLSLAAAEKNYAEAVRRAKEEAADLATLANDIKTEALKVKSERKGFESLCDMNVLSAYKRLREKEKGTSVVVPIKSGACMHCSIKLTPQTMNQAKKGELVFCDNCGAVIYDPESPSDYQS